jgi:hypothetical protein
MSDGFIYVVDAHFIDNIEENKYPKKWQNSKPVDGGH